MKTPGQLSVQINTAPSVCAAARATASETCRLVLHRPHRPGDRRPSLPPHALPARGACGKDGIDKRRRTIGAQHHRATRRTLALYPSQGFPHPLGDRHRQWPSWCDKQQSCARGVGRWKLLCGSPLFACPAPRLCLRKPPADERFAMSRRPTACVIRCGGHACKGGPIPYVSLERAAAGKHRMRRRR